jgi:hypothetical protein
MGILYPKEAIARRWDGALQARLRRAPLELFLGGQRTVSTPVGASRDTDNLARATVIIVQAGLDLYLTRDKGIAFSHRPVVGHMACLVSVALAQQIFEPDLWRGAAQISTTRCLSPLIGFDTASMMATAVAQRFQKAIAIGVSPLDWRISKSAREAVHSNQSSALAKVAANIAARLNAEAPIALICGPLLESQPG